MATGERERERGRERERETTWLMLFCTMGLCNTNEEYEEEEYEVYSCILPIHGAKGCTQGLGKVKAHRKVSPEVRSEIRKKGFCQFTDPASRYQCPFPSPPIVNDSSVPLENAAEDVIVCCLSVLMFLFLLNTNKHNLCFEMFDFFFVCAGSEPPTGTSIGLAAGRPSWCRGATPRLKP